MVVRNYSNHITPEGIYPWQRLNSAGISFVGTGEILHTIAGTCVVDGFIGFMVSTGHRKVVLDPAHIYAGPGMAFINGEGAITINFITFIKERVGLVWFSPLFMCPNKAHFLRKCIAKGGRGYAILTFFIVKMMK
jgi:hypothetical protein